MRRRTRYEVLFTVSITIVVIVLRIISSPHLFHETPVSSPLLIKLKL